jgi:hypothetical protein
VPVVPVSRKEALYCLCVASKEAQDRRWIHRRRGISSSSTGQRRMRACGPHAGWRTAEPRRIHKRPEDGPDELPPDGR